MIKTIINWFKRLWINNKYPKYAIITKTADKGGRIIEYDDVWIKENDHIVTYCKLINDKYVSHRIDGPAHEYKTCYTLNTWYYRGKRIDCKSQKEFEKILKLKIFW